MAGLLPWLIQGDPTPGEERWRELGVALLMGDPQMDDLLDWMITAGMAGARPLFERALAEGSAAVPGAPEPLRAFFAHVERRPEWVDAELLADGARACQMSGRAGIFALRDAALMGGYQAAALNQTLLLTGALSRGALHRVAETLSWWLDCTALGGMDVRMPGFTNTLRVRLVHGLLRRKVSELPGWRREVWGLPINQADMMGTYLGFSVVFLLGARLLGALFTAAEARAVMHLWRYIGWLMGVEERWLVDGEMEGRILLYQYTISQAPPDESSVQMGRALMDEPLHRPYPRFRTLRGRFVRARHLSINRLFLGRAGMRALGLPENVLPWYPLLTVPPALLQHGLWRAVPGGREHRIRAGRLAQELQLRDLTGAKPVTAAMHLARG